MKDYEAFSRERRFADLTEAVAHCSLCRERVFSRKILSEVNGNICSRVVFVAEAPGRLGAARTGIPLFGDKTGDNFEKLLTEVGWQRKDVFVTNALLCNPKDDNGNNRTPTKQEVRNCAAYLLMTINLIKPDVIVTLGSKALQALSCIRDHTVTLRNGVGQLIPWNGSLLFPLYHPGPRALIHRRFDQQRKDIRRLATLVHPERGLELTQKGCNALNFVPSRMQHTIVAVAQFLRKLTYFRLAKLLYFIDLIAIREIGSSVTGEIYVRQKDGPWPPRLFENTDPLTHHELIVSLEGGVSMVKVGPAPRFEVNLDYPSLKIIFSVIERYGGMSNSEIKTAAYLSSPMRYVLQLEKRGKAMMNKPVIYENLTAEELDR